MTFPEWLRAARAAAGLTQTQLGALCGVGKQCVYYWEAGRTRPSRLDDVLDNLLIHDGDERDNARMLAAAPCEHWVERGQKAARELCFMGGSYERR